MLVDEAREVTNLVKALTRRVERNIVEQAAIAGALNQSVLGDKDWRGILRALGGAVDHFILTNAPTAPASRAWVATEALEFAKARGYQAELEPDFDRALQLAPSRGVTVLVTGSFHTVGDAMARLAVSPTPG